MRYRIAYSPRSLRDLERIRTYLTRETQEPETATRIITELLEACERLATFPERFPVYPNARQWRMMPAAHYLVFFQVYEREVYVGYIRHGARKPFGS